MNISFRIQARRNVLSQKNRPRCPCQCWLLVFGLLQCKDDHHLVIIWQFVIKIQDSGMTLCNARRSLLRTANGIANGIASDILEGKKEMEIKITGWGHNASFLVSFHSKLHCGRRGEWLGCARSDLLMSSSFHPSLLWACLVYPGMSMSSMSC